MWSAIASLGMSLISGAAERGTQRARNMVLDAQAAAENTIREGKNIEVAGYDALDKWVSSENNRRAAKAGGAAFTAAQQTLARTQDAYASGDIETQLATAEQAGAYAANAAFSGAAGASVNAISYSAQAQQERARLYQQRNQGFATYDAMQQIAGISAQNIESLEIVRGAASLDKGKSISQATPVSGNWMSDVLKWGLSNAAGAQQIAGGIGGFFNTPQATGPYALSIGGGSPSLRVGGGQMLSYGGLTSRLP